MLSGESLERFQRFWILYPRKVGIGAAEKAWEKINPSKELFDLILQAVNDNKRSRQWLEDNGRYIPHPTTWLNRKQWLDEIEFAPKSWLPKPENETETTPMFYKNGRWYDTVTGHPLHPQPDIPDPGSTYAEYPCNE